MASLALSPDSSADPVRLLLSGEMRGRWVGLLLRFLFTVLFGLQSLDCSRSGLPEQTLELPLEFGDPTLTNRNGVLLHSGIPFTGTLIERADQQLFRKTPYHQGKRHGLALAFYPDGRLAYEKWFRKGNREGVHKGYWPSGQLQFVYRYRNDLFDGEQVGYYKTGQRSALHHYRQGYEEGLQSGWDAEGRLIANYTVKEGKRYGIVGRFDCVSVH
jgi:hypothetical protein